VEGLTENSLADLLIEWEGGGMAVDAIRCSKNTLQKVRGAEIRVEGTDCITEHLGGWGSGQEYYCPTSLRHPKKTTTYITNNAVLGQPSTGCHL